MLVGTSLIEPITLAKRAGLPCAAKLAAGNAGSKEVDVGGVRRAPATIINWRDKGKQVEDSYAATPSTECTEFGTQCTAITWNEDTAKVY